MILIDENFKGEMLKNTYIALGSFDGVHKGHLTLINKTIELSKEKNGLSMVYTFKNHPLTLINKDIAPKLLMDNKAKEDLFEKLGLDILCLIDFNKEIMEMNPRDFIVYLVKKFNAKGIVVGFNYRFGYKNCGDLNLLEELSKEFSFDLYVMEAYLYKDEVVSSTRIRHYIKRGEVEKAFHMLDKPFKLNGIVVHGRKLGRTIGFPTANIKVKDEMIIPKTGVYYTNIEYNKKIYKGITSIGNNPTVNGKTITIETYILNLNEDLYGKEIKLSFIQRMRNEQKFKSLEELKKQLEKDKNFAKNQYIKSNL